jgi:hypothetical protein
MINIPISRILILLLLSLFSNYYSQRVGLEWENSEIFRINKENPRGTFAHS